MDQYQPVKAAMEAATPPGIQTWFLARCVDCDFDLPFPTEDARDRWADGHRGVGHTVRHITERRWRDPAFPPVAQRTERRSPTAGVAGSNPARGTFTVRDLMRECAKLTPYIEAAKVGSVHAGHDGWTMRHDRPGVLCGCGEPITELLAGRPAPPD